MVVFVLDKFVLVWFEESGVLKLIIRGVVFVNSKINIFNMRGFMD